MSDAIDTLAGIAPGSFLDELRRRKPVTRDNAQATFAALFDTGDVSELSAAERGAVAYFVALIHKDEAAIAFYRELQLEPAMAGALEAEAKAGAAAGPYGRFPDGPLSREDEDGPIFAISFAGRAALGERLSAGLAHVHMLVFHPRDAAPAHLRALEEAGWSATAIVTLSQLVSFLAFQIRAAAGLRALERSRSVA